MITFNGSSSVQWLFVTRLHSRVSALLFGHHPVAPFDVVDFVLIGEIVERGIVVAVALAVIESVSQVIIIIRIGRAVPQRFVFLHRIVGFGPHLRTHMNGNGVFLDVEQPRVHDLAVDLHHGHVIGGSLH